MCHTYDEKLSKMLSWKGSVCSKRTSSHVRCLPLYSVFLLLCFQMAAKMGGDQMSNMNSSSPVIDPSLYSFGGQKRSLDNGGKFSAIHMTHITSRV